MDLATPDRATLAAAHPTAEQVASLAALAGLTDFIQYLLPEQLSGVSGVAKLLEGYAFDMLEGSNAQPGAETLYASLTALSRLLAGVKHECDRMSELADRAREEARTLRAAAGVLDATTLRQLITVGTTAEPAAIERVRSAAHELRRMADADESYLAALRAYEAALEAQGWRLRWTVTPQNVPYLELTAKPSKA